MFDFLSGLLFIQPLAIILAIVLAVGGFTFFGTWVGVAGAIVGLAAGFFLETWLGSQFSAFIKRSKWAGTMLIFGGLLALTVIALATR